MFLNPEIKNKLIQQKKYMEEIDFNPFVPNVLYDNLMEFDVKKSKEYKGEIKDISIKNKSKKSKDKVEVKSDNIELKHDKELKPNNKDIKPDIEVKPNDDEKIKLPDIPLEKPGVEVDVLDTAELSSDEKNNVKNIIVDPSFF